MLKTSLAFILAAACVAAFAQPPTYPMTRKVDRVDDYFGTKVADPYRWLENDNAAETKSWVESENKVTSAVLDRIPFRAEVRQRVRALSNYRKYSAPFRKNGKVFFFLNDGLQNQAVLYVQDGLDGTPKVLLDPNTFSPDGTVRLASFTLSKDGRYAAYARTAIPGSDWQDIHVMEMASGRTLPDVLHWVKFSTPAWQGDGFYYSRFPTPAKGSELTVRVENETVLFHRVGTAQDADRPVFANPAHPDWFVGVETTRDERFAVLTQQDPGKRGNDVAVMDLGRSESRFHPVVAEIGEDRYDVVDNVGERLLILTNHGAPNSKLMRADPAQPAAAWETVIAERPDLLEGVSSVCGKLFARYLKDVATRVEVSGLDGSDAATIDLPGPGSASGFDGEHGDTDVFYVFTSMNQPPSILRYDIAAAKSTLFRAPEIPGFDASRYESRQVFFTSRDGTRVPMFLVYRKGLQLDGRNPTILYGYGGFNVSLTPYFSAARVAWLEQGGVFAMANLRGGGEYGEAWHEAGMRFNKQNVFDDCIAAAEYLIAQGYTTPGRLALQGGSNGGLLVGAVVNQRPDLFKAALPEVGVMDMLRYQKFSVGAAWVSDYGSSDDEKQFVNLFKYSPLQNIQAGKNYPAILVTTSDHDDRVVPAHSFKYIATMQEKAPDGPPKLIRIATNSGHGASNLTKALDETADAYSFVWSVMGVVPTFTSLH